MPTTAEELLAWAKANPNKFMYARPTNSGPGRTFMMGLPYILGDKDPQDPVSGWDKTWAYLQELGQYIEYYPAGTGATMKEFGDGSRDIIISTTGWDINPRALGIVPKEAKIETLKGFHWVSDAFFMCVPKGVPNDRLAVVLDMMAYVLTPKAQAYAYDEGYLYPGPAVKNVPLSLAPKAKPGRDRGIRPAGICRPHRQQPDRAAAEAREDGRRLPEMGRAGRLQARPLI